LGACSHEHPQSGGCARIHTPIHIHPKQHDAIEQRTPGVPRRGSCEHVASKVSAPARTKAFKVRIVAAGPLSLA